MRGHTASIVPQRHRAKLKANGRTRWQIFHSECIHFGTYSDRDELGWYSPAFLLVHLHHLLQTTRLMDAAAALAHAPGPGLSEGYVAAACGALLVRLALCQS